MLLLTSIMCMPRLGSCGLRHTGASDYAAQHAQHAQHDYLKLRACTRPIIGGHCASRHASCTGAMCVPGEVLQLTGCGAVSAGWHGYSRFVRAGAPSREIFQAGGRPPVLYGCTLPVSVVIRLAVDKAGQG